MGVFRTARLKVGPTEFRILPAVGTVYLLYKPWVVVGGTPYRLFDVGGIVTIAAVARNTRGLYRAKPLPR